MIDLRERTDTTFRDPLRERDLADLGIEAEVTIVGGPPHHATVTLTPFALDELIKLATLGESALYGEIPVEDW